MTQNRWTNGSKRYYRRLLAAGVAIHEWSDSILHAKVATVDGRRLLVGSFNLDPFSLANLEALVEVAEPRVIEQGEAWIQDHFVRSRQMTAVDASSWLRRWLLDPLGRIVARLADAISRVVVSRKRRRGAPDFALALQSPGHARTDSGGGTVTPPPDGNSANSPDA